MITDGRGFGTGLALHAIVKMLEAKGVFTHGELVTALDSALADLDGLRARDIVISPEASADASQAIGLLYT